MVRSSRPCFALALAATLLLAVGAAAQTRTETLRWTHPTPSEVEGFRVHYGTSSRVYTQQIDVRLPPTDAGAFVYDLVVPEADDIYVAVSAYDADGLSSVLSNEKMRPGSGSSGGGSDGGGSDPGDGTPQAAVTGFALWNAQNGSLIDGDFGTNEQIDRGAFPCTAIEILGNDYLDRSRSPGSVQKALDGAVQSCTDAPTTHENDSPYAWPTDQGPGEFACASYGVGSHVLTVVPFDGDDCTGLAGEPVTLEFEVVDSTLPDPDAPLGQPGRPQLVQ